MNLELYQLLFGLPYSKTEETFSLRVEQSKAGGDPLTLCRSLLDMTFAEIHMGSVVKALRIAQDAITLAEQNSLTELAVEGRLWRDVANHFTNSRDAETHFEKLVKEAASVGRRDLSAIACSLRARELKRENQHDQAAEFIDQTLQILADVEDPYVRTIVLRLTGMLMRVSNQLDAAVQLLEESRQTAEASGLMSQLARTLTVLGSTYVEEQRPKEGLEELQRAQELYELLEINDWYTAETLMNIAILNDIAEEPARGIPYANQAVELFDKVGDKQQSAVAQNVHGVLLRKTGELDKALVAFQQATLRFQSVPEPHPKAGLPLANAGLILVQRKQFDEALKLLSAAQEMTLLNPTDNAIQHVYASLGSLYDAESNPLRDSSLAEKYLVDGYAVTALHEMTSPQILDELARFYEHQKNFQLALRFTKEGYEVRERVRDSNIQRQFMHLEVKQRIAEAQRVAEIEHLRNVELKAAQTLLVESERLASIGQLTAGIAHEINNPVTFITSSIGPLRRDIAEYETLKDSGEPVAEVREEIQQLLNAIESGAKRTAEIVQSLRTFSRLDEAELKQADIVSGIESTLTLLATRIRGQVEVVKHYERIPPVECRPGQINQVVMNIISNALDAIENVVDPTIHISVRQLDTESIELKFQDNGPGIPEGVKSKLFEPFFTTKDVGKGTGLGLSISHGIIERHGGKISVSNEPGACFSIVIPITQSSQLNDNQLENR